MAKCGAKKKRVGTPCQAAAMQNGRCRVHGGMNPGSSSPERSALKHGIYAKLIHDDDLEDAAAYKTVTGVDNELLIARIQLKRALKAQSNADTMPDGLEIHEVINRDGAENAVDRSEIKKRLRDYPAIINTILGRIEGLEKTRQLLIDGLPGGAEIDGFEIREYDDET